VRVHGGGGGGGGGEKRARREEEEAPQKDIDEGEDGDHQGGDNHAHEKELDVLDEKDIPGFLPEGGGDGDEDEAEKAAVDLHNAQLQAAQAHAQQAQHAHGMNPLVKASIDELLSSDEGKAAARKFMSTRGNSFKLMRVAYKLRLSMNQTEEYRKDLSNEWKVAKGDLPCTAETCVGHVDRALRLCRGLYVPTKGVPVPYGAATETFKTTTLPCPHDPAVTLYSAEFDLRLS